MKTTTTLALMAVGAEALLGLDVNLPLGINVDLDLLGKRPQEDPCQECLDTWHPPHDVIIDDCDDTGAGDWHWIHPCPEHEPEEPSFTWGTSTMTATHTSTVISCPPEVPDCPGQSTMYTTVTAETTICPIPIETPAVPTHEVPAPEPTTKVPEVPQVPTTKVPEVPQVPTTKVPEVPQVPTTEVPYVPVPTKEIPQAPPAQETPWVPAPPAPTTWVEQPPATFSTAINTPWVPAVPSVPVAQPPAPPVNTPVVPPHVSMPPYGNNATEPVPTPPIVTPPPAAGAAQNVQNMGVAAIAGLAAFALL